MYNTGFMITAKDESLSSKLIHLLTKKQTYMYARFKNTIISLHHNLQWVSIYTTENKYQPIKQYILKVTKINQITNRFRPKVQIMKVFNILNFRRIIIVRTILDNYINGWYNMNTQWKRQ